MDVRRWARQELGRTNPAVWWLGRIFATRAGFERFCLVYAHFRWADDIVDAPGRDPAAVARFVAEQRGRIATGGDPGAHPAEAAVTRALAEDPSLRPAVEGMWEALAWDAARGPGPRPAAEIEAQIRRIGDAYLLGLCNALGVRDPLPEAIFELSRAATGVHQIRDVSVDRSLGYINVPAEDLAGIDPRNAPIAAFQPWIHARAAALHARFEAGEAALSQVKPLGARIALTLFSWRYRRLLRRLER